MKALYIEDNESDIVLLNAKIELSNHWEEFTAVHELNDGIQLCHQKKFDIVYVDLNLTTTKGTETIIKFRESIKDVPVIVFSGIDDKRTALRTIQEGAQDYIPKHEINADLLYKSTQFAIERFKKGMRLEIANSNVKQSEEIAKIGNCTIDLNGQIIDISNGFKKLFNFEKDSIFQLDQLAQLFIEEDEVRFEKAFNQVTEKLSNQELVVKSKNKGQERIFKIGFSLNSQNVFLGHVIHLTCLDITSEYQQKRELELRHNRLLKAQELAKIGSWEFNVNSEKFTFSPEALNILEFNSNHSFGIDEVLNLIEIEENVIELYHQLRSINHNEENFQFEVNIITPEKNHRVLKITAEYDQNSRQDNAIYVGTVEDVTLRRETSRLRKELTESMESQVIERTKELEEVKTQLEKSLKKEIELNELKSQFVSTASHQFRTPLTIIESSTGLISHYLKEIDFPKKERVEDSILRLHQQVDRMIALMENILVLGKIENNAFELNSKSLDLLDIIIAICNDSNIIQNDALQIEVIDGMVGDHTINSDKNILEHIFTNLITNALKYSDKEKNPKIILNGSENQIVINVIDYGIGIPQENLSRLFEPFSRASNVGEIQGSGLGMAIVLQCVELLDGTIQVESKINEGTKVTVTLPRNG